MVASGHVWFLPGGVNVLDGNMYTYSPSRELNISISTQSGKWNIIFKHTLGGEVAVYLHMKTLDTIWELTPLFFLRVTLVFLGGRMR